MIILTWTVTLPLAFKDQYKNKNVYMRKKKKRLYSLKEMTHTCEISKRDPPVRSLAVVLIGINTMHKENLAWLYFSLSCSDGGNPIKKVSSCTLPTKTNKHTCSKKCFF